MHANDMFQADKTTVLDKT